MISVFISYYQMYKTYNACYIGKIALYFDRIPPLLYFFVFLFRFSLSNLVTLSFPLDLAPAFETFTSNRNQSENAF